jgi:hypothetical protein
MFTGNHRIREATDQEMVSRSLRCGSLGNILVESEWKRFSTQWVIRSSHSTIKQAEKALNKLNKGA